MAPAFATHPMCRTSWGTSSLWGSDLSGKKFKNDFINFCFWLSIGRNVTKLMEIFRFKDIMRTAERFFVVFGILGLSVVIWLIFYEHYEVC